MASKRKKAYRKCPPCTEATMARHAFSEAIKHGHCDVAANALRKVVADANARAPRMTKGQVNLVAQEHRKKWAKIQKCENSESNRFNGLLGLGILGIL